MGSSAGTLINLNDLNPPAPAGSVNVKWQGSAPYTGASGYPQRDASANLAPFAGDAGSGGAPGAVPAPASGDASAGKYLRADGTWAIPPSAGGGFSPGGDLSGTATSQTVIGLEGKPLDAATVAAPADGQVITYEAASGKYKAKTPAAGGGTGTVTSVGMTVPPEFAVSPGAITTSGTFAVTKATEPANQVWAGPSSGAAAAPAFRALVASDIPNIAESQVTNLPADLASKVSSSRQILTSAPLTGGGDLSADRTLAISSFGASGSSHASGAVPDPGATAGTTRFLREDATWAVPPAGTGGATITVNGV